MNQTANLNIVELELLTIRYMAWLIEALTWPHVSRDCLHPSTRDDIIHRLADEIEHTAQYHLEQISIKDRARYLMRNAERLRSLVDSNKTHLDQVRLNKPTLEDIDYLEVNLKQILR